MPFTYENTRAGYANLWREMSIRQTRLKRVDEIAKKLIEHKAEYQKVEKSTGVPWYFIGLLHYRESNCNFTKHLHNGDSLKARTKRVPAGHPKTGNPPFDWDFSAIDALKIKGFHKIRDWSIERVLFESEIYNGLGYVGRKINSPYIWSYTNHYAKGKYVADGKYSASAVDAQCGVAPILKRLIELDRSVRPHLHAEKKTPIQTVRDSMSLPMLLVSIVLTVAERLFGAVTGAFDTVLWAFNILPSVTDEIDSVMSSGKKLAEWFGQSWSDINLTYLVVVMIVVFVREFSRKQTQP